MRKFLFYFTIITFFGCTSQNSKLINPSGKNIKERILVPPGFVRTEVKSTTYDEYLRELPLKKTGDEVLLFNGKKKNRQDVHEAIIDYDIGKKDLQQCADAVMRIRAEYLYHSIQFDKIHFNFTNGFNCEYIKYAEGYRYSVKHNEWVKSATVDYTYETFKKYLQLVFNYAGSLSLSKELKQVKDLNDIQPGDVFIKGGSPGHAVIVVDVAKNPTTGLIIFAIAQSYMPAQSIHILKNFNSPEISPWYNINFGFELVTPEWTFKRNELMRFAD